MHNLYRAWGEKLHSQRASGDNRFCYTGHLLDEDLSRELYYCGARYYDTKLKIFTQVDPMYVKYPGWGSYVYCLGNPVKYVDPDGEKVRYSTGAYDPGPEFKQAFADAVQHLNRHGLGGPLAELERSEKIFELQTWREGTGKGSFYAGGSDEDETNIIVWDFRHGITWESGGQSAATGLYEETVHGLHDLTNRELYHKDLSTPDPNWGNVEELKTSEAVNAAAVKTGESPRSSHSQGKSVPVETVTAVPNVEMDSKTGMPTAESLAKVLDRISTVSGKKGDATAAYIKNDNYDAMVQYAHELKGQNSNKDRKPYSVWFNNCMHFVKAVLEAGDVKTPWLLDPRPNSYIHELRDRFKQFQYDAAKKTTLNYDVSQN